jgi:hypothetical protein
MKMNTEPDDGTDEPVITYVDIEAEQRAQQLGISQTQTLNLKPWQVPTDRFFWDRDRIDEILAAGRGGSDIGQFQCATLAKQLLEAGLSLHEPDPVRALNDFEYRKEIDARVLKLKIANKNGLTDQIVETLIRLAPYPLLRPTYEDPHAEKETTEFHRLLAKQPVRDIAACERVMSVLWEKHVEQTRVYDDDGNRIVR